MAKAQLWVKQGPTPHDCNCDHQNFAHLLTFASLLGLPCRLLHRHPHSHSVVGSTTAEHTGLVCMWPHVSSSVALPIMSLNLCFSDHL